MISLIKRYAIYLLRWQLSTPILAIVIALIHLSVVWQTVVANLIGALIFFWVDRLIFKQKPGEAKPAEQLTAEVVKQN